jgi:Holliday junction resolvasome RuvABC endonuclease subunit
MKGIKWQVLGIDPSARKLALTLLHGEEETEPTNLKPYCFYQPFPGTKFDTSHITIGTSFVHKVVTQLDPDLQFTTYAVIEGAVVGKGGVWSTVSQTYVAGAIIDTLQRYNIPVQIVNNSTWKKVAIGKGNASKEDIANHIKSMYPTTEFHNQDMCDATGIALYGWDKEVINGRRRTT